MSQEVEAAIDAIAREIAVVKNEAIAEIHRELVESTPVDTGWAASNWIPSVGEPATDAGGPGAVVAGLAQVMACMDIDAERFITNPVEYMPYLAEGSSPQAPAGWIDAAVERANNFIEQREASREKKL